MWKPLQWWNRPPTEGKRNMTDFLFIPRGEASTDPRKALQIQYPRLFKESEYFSGDWGHLIVTGTHYPEFSPCQNDRWLAVVVGGPLLGWRQHAGPADRRTRNGATAELLRRWLTGRMDWSEDLDGPFCVVLVDKKKGSVHCITDLMLFTPVYIHTGRCGPYLSTHVDALATTCGAAPDPVSAADFIDAGHVTHPFTLFAGVEQLNPASIYCFDLKTAQNTQEQYWYPEETCPFANINEAADRVRQALAQHTSALDRKSQMVAHFISGGEDSRLVGSLLQRPGGRDAFYAGENRTDTDYRTAAHAASMLGARLHILARSPDHYLNHMAAACRLIGSGHQCKHAHMLNIAGGHNLRRYDAVVGGLLADSLLKGAQAPQWPSSGRLEYLPRIGRRRAPPFKYQEIRPFQRPLSEAIFQRRKAHHARVAEYRPESTTEWCHLWPMTQRNGSANLLCNRRLFASHEPFAAHAVVKASAAIPLQWKLNRNLFWRIARPLLRETRHLPTSRGDLPDRPWYVSSPTLARRWFQRRIEASRGNGPRKPGSWADWRALSQYEAWQTALQQASEVSHELGITPTADALLTAGLPLEKQFNAMQLLHLPGRAG